jgi:tetratricopeptide (TPR) repeat protein
MPLTSEELIQKSRDQRARGRLDEALVSALAAVDADKVNSHTWWQLALCRQELKDWKNALTAFQKFVELEPLSDIAWSWVAETHKKLADTGAAEEAYRKALSINETNKIALKGMGDIYHNRDDISEREEELSLLEQLERSSGDLLSYQNNRLGLLHYRLGNAHNAIKYCAISHKQSSHISNLHIIGLAYNSLKISQDADAVDMWRLALQSQADYQLSLDMIAKVLPRLTELRKGVKSSSTNVLKDDELFDIYINPFELLGVGSETDVEDLDVKQIQNFKKRLLQEIDLEDGMVSWLKGAHIDKSRAIKVCDELNDENLKFYHSLVFQDGDLLAFLTRGEVEHFLVGEQSSLDLIKELDDAPEFKEWLGQYFAPQFDRILARALDGENLQLIECLLDGRRWVTSTQDIQCFQNSRRVIDRMIQPLRDIAEVSEEIKPSYSDIEAVLESTLLLQKLNFLPLFFEEEQNDAVRTLRSIAITCINVHDDSALSEKIIRLCQKFHFKSVEIQQRISKDSNDISEIIAEERKNEVSLTSGDNTWKITKEGVALNDRRIAVNDVTGVTWGSTVIQRDYIKEYKYTVSVRGKGPTPIVFDWTATNNVEKQQKYFKDLIDAVFEYVMPSLLERLDERLRKGEVIRIGPCSLTNAGIQFSVKGWFSTSLCDIPWSRCVVSVDNGEMTVREEGAYKNKVTFSFKATENAPTLLILAGRRKG